MKVLVIGSGGREHCLAWKLSQSALVDKLYCAPGNGGTVLLAENLDISATDIESLLKFAKTEKIDLTVVGPEAPLVKGIVDQFESQGLKIFGPRKDLARLEGSKVFSKEMMRKFSVPTADFEVFDSPDKAKEYIDRKGAPIVIKADGLAAGKGVIVARTQDEAKDAIDMIMVDRKFGSAGYRVIIEDCLKGQEASILIFSDGETILPLVSSQDHKAAFDGDKGPNTGGMGAYSPAPLVNDQLLKKIIDQVFKPLIDGLRAEGKPYRGILYAGLMIKDEEISVLEFNVRFGDPETQAILPKLKSDLFEIMLKTAEGRLNGVNLEWDERFCLCVVLASGGYPGNYEKFKEITGLEKLENREDVFVFHAGTKFNQKLLTSGGRVLGVVGLGDTIKDAQIKAYQAIDDIQFDKMFYRKDIGDKALRESLA
ncbi:MAG: phosphoribosylamine--glycine ligase [Candidatus Omnitrophica bacterium]|nr:phosphoribosylamine--glycine ligase [Candidatus Omnitrophota bacterium]